MCVWVCMIAMYSEVGMVTYVPYDCTLRLNVRNIGGKFLGVRAIPRGFSEV